MITHTVDGVLRPRIAVARHVAVDTRLNEAIALRRCALYRKAFRGLAVGYPADALRLDAVASWIRGRGVTVDAASIDQLDLLRMVEIDSSQVVMHCHGEVPISIRRTALSRFVVNTGEQIAELADNPLARRHHVVVDQARSDEFASEVLSHPRLALVGLHTRLDGAELGDLAESVVSMIATMARIRRTHAVLLSSVSISGVDVADMQGDLRSVCRVAGAVDQAVEDGCVRFRFPRPALTVSPRRSLILPA